MPRQVCPHQKPHHCQSASGTPHEWSEFDPPQLGQHAQQDWKQNCGSASSTVSPILRLLVPSLPLRGSVVPAQDPRAPRREHHQHCRRHQTPPLFGSVPAKSSDRLQLRMHFSEDELRAGLTVTAPTTPVNGARVVEARVCDSVAMRVGSPFDCDQVCLRAAVQRREADGTG